MGAGRREHHAQQEAMRAANAEANRIAEQQRAYEAMLQAQRDAMLKQTEMMREAKAPQTLRSTVGEQGAGVRTASSRRKTTTAASTGAAALRIPLNLGGGSVGGLNIG